MNGIERRKHFLSLIMFTLARIKFDIQTPLRYCLCHKWYLSLCQMVTVQFVFISKPFARKTSLGNLIGLYQRALSNWRRLSMWKLQSSEEKITWFETKNADSLLFLANIFRRVHKMRKLFSDVRYHAYFCCIFVQFIP